MNENVSEAVIDVHRIKFCVYFDPAFVEISEDLLSYGWPSLLFVAEELS